MANKIFELEDFIKENKKTLILLTNNLRYFAKGLIKEKNLQINNFFLRLDNLSVQKVLKRGFSIVRDLKQKKILKSSNIKNEI